MNFGHGRLLAGARERGLELGPAPALGTRHPGERARGATWRLAAIAVRPGPPFATALVSAPVLALSFAAAALGESLGYVLGPGRWPEQIEVYELETPRALGAGPGG